MVLSLWQSDHNHMDSYLVSTVDVLESSIASGARGDSSSSVIPCVIMNNDGVLYHQVSSFSPECWTKVVLQECTVIGSVYYLPWRYIVVKYYPIKFIHHSDHHLHSTLCRAHFLWTRDASIHFIRFSSLVHMSEPRFCP